MYHLKGRLKQKKMAGDVQLQQEFVHIDGNKMDLFPVGVGPHQAALCH